MGDGVLVGGPGDRIAADDLVTLLSHRELGQRLLNVVGQSTLKQLAALLSQVDVLVSNDSGPMHLAAAVGTPVVGLFGPTNPLRNGPWNADDVWVSRFDDCECHHKRQCRRETPCIDTITVAEVALMVDQRLGQGGWRG